METYSLLPVRRRRARRLLTTTPIAQRATLRSATRFIPGRVHAGVSALASFAVLGGFLMPAADAAGMGALVLLLGAPWPLTAMVSIFLLTFFVYALNRVVELDIDGVSNPERTRLLRAQRPLQIALVGAALLAAIPLQLRAATWQAVACAAAWTATGIWYCFGLKNLTRRVTALKAYVIGAMYGLWPLYALWFGATSLPAGTLAIAAFVVLRMFFSTTVSDLKDIDMDRAQGLRTWAVIMSAERLRIALHVLNAASAVPIVVGVLADTLPRATLGLLLCIPFGLFYPRANSRDTRRARWLTAVVVDSEGFVWVLGVLLGLSLTGAF